MRTTERSVVQLLQCFLRAVELAIWVAEVEAAGEKLEVTLEPRGKT